MAYTIELGNYHIVLNKIQAVSQIEELPRGSEFKVFLIGSSLPVILIECDTLKETLTKRVHLMQLLNEHFY